MAISVNSKELTEILDVTPSTQNIMLVGKHGIGKSEILTNYFNKKGMKVVSLFLGQMADPGDLIGLPHKNEETGKTDFMPPYWFPVDNEPIVLFLDELNRARPELLQTVMDLALNRKLAGRYLPEGSRIISAVNDGEEYQLTDLDPALVSRFNIYNFRPTNQEWLRWADKAGVDERIISFISENPKALEEMGRDIDNGLDKTPDRRGWKKVSDLIKGVDELGDVYRKVIGGIVGVSTMTLFFTSLGANRLLSASDIIEDFPKHEKKVKKYKLADLCTLNESIFRYIEKEFDNLDVEVASKNLGDYFNCLMKGSNKEAFAHMINMIESEEYQNTTVFLLTNLQEVYDNIMKFIKAA